MYVSYPHTHHLQPETNESFKAHIARHSNPTTQTKTITGQNNPVRPHTPAPPVLLVVCTPAVVLDEKLVGILDPAVLVLVLRAEVCATTDVYEDTVVESVPAGGPSSVVVVVVVIVLDCKVGPPPREIEVGRASVIVPATAVGPESASVDVWRARRM
jgi:hypothetical protein